ncbi:Nonribosomal peptide synthetase 2 [Elsinoe australis]|uniref:Nonribosomal peptide synthetase 2 n=1 Tax=Elsinoe australis TaxID=40998 RepID=A0A2P8A6E2_9PEZI|nr:Nonribosomal peptide synthetase 2 [Elsinoe australis]
MSILNPSPKVLPGPSLLHHLIADEETNATALEYHDSNGLGLQLSYRQLHQRAADLARILSQRRKTPSTSASITPLLIPQSAALYISQIAILKSGSAFCPLNLDVPEERLKFILNDVSATIVLTTSEFKDKFASVPDLQVLVLDKEGNLVESGSDGSTKTRSFSAGLANDRDESLTGGRQVVPTDPAYIMYTSGSTGTPKAVVLSHRAVTQSLLAHDRFIPQFSRFLQFANPTFDVSVFEIYFPLFRRATLVSCDRTYLLSDLSNVITKLNVEGAELTPSVVASLVRSRKTVPKLRTLLTIGEMLNPQTVREFAGTNDDDSLLYGMYGPTEAAIHCTLQPSFKQSDTVNTIGIPFDTVSCFVIKPSEECNAPDDVQIVPQGEVGELAVGGHQLADGYLNREEQTKAVFINHPTYGPLYRTGDKAKLTSAGLLECLGRISKGQVKLRGQRIELGEIEHAASKLEGVHAASASVIEGQLVLFSVADSSQIKPADIEASCRKWLPRFMVPNDIVILKDFPYLPSGKTDSKKLDADYKAQMADAPEDQRSKSSDNHKLLDILRTHVNKTIKPTTNLASVGLDSLKAIRLATELRKQGYPQLSAVDLLMCTTIRDIDTLIARSSSSPQSKPTADVIDFKAVQQDLRRSVEQISEVAETKGSISDVFPCTPLQDAMLVETAKNPKAYCNSATFSLPAGTSFEDFSAAIKAVAEQHSALRSGFVQFSHGHSAYSQIVWSEMLDHQLSSVASLDADFALSRSSDLLRPLQVQYVGNSQSPQALILLHHALYDQWSLDILVDDLYLALKKLTVPSRPSFAAVSCQSLANLSSRQRQNTLKAFWRSYLAGNLYTKLPNLTGKLIKGITLGILERQSSITSSQLSRLAARYKVGDSVIFQAAYGYLLSLYAGQPDITFGTVFSGRTAAIEGVQDLFGPMLSTLPTRFSSTGIRRFKDLARSVQKSNRDIMAHTDLPLIAIKKAANIEPSTSLFDSIFVWQGSPREATDQTDIRLVDTTDFVEFDLTLDVEPSNGSYHVKATYRQSVLPETQVAFFLDQLDLIIGQLADFPECRLDELFVDVRPQKCLSIFNPDPSRFDCSGGLARLIDESIAKHPKDAALCFAKNISDHDFGYETLTYEELSRKANQMAHVMLARDLRPGSLVCIIMEKSVNLYISILATIKAGCGYLPIVPSTPIHRIEKIVDDADIAFVLCDGASAQNLQSTTISSNDICIVDDLPLSQQSDHRPCTTANPQDVAYAVYTSGTTGTPKGVLVTHENICSNLKMLGHLYPIAEESRLLQVCNQAFDVSVFEIFFTWSQGMCLCSATNDVLFRDLELSVRQFGVTHLSMTPTVAALVKPDNAPKVKFLVTSGEPLTGTIHRRWAGRGLYQGYGPSETTNICTVNIAMPLEDTINNIGQSFANTSTFVLPQNGDFAPLPRGALGELCFGGQQVFQGYQSMPDLTAGKVINHPRYGRIYRSGDLGRLAPDGSILIEGRTDTQRKIRGQRIELSEVNNTILGCSAVLDATVLITGEHGAETLVAFWIPEHSSKNGYSILDIDREIVASIADIKKELETNLPSYMVPSSLIPISAFPMTGQSKVDNGRLLEDFGDLPDDYIEQLADEDGIDDGEWTDTDHSIRQILTDTLGAPETSIHRNTALFGLGLDSLSAIRLAANIKTKVGVQMDVSTILKKPKLALLSEFVDSQERNQVYTNGHVSLVETFMSSDQTEAIKDRCRNSGLEVDRILPCTPLQEAMLSASISQGSGAYRNRNVLKLNASPNSIKSSWAAMVNRHDILRTVFMSTEDARYPFVQIVTQTVDLPWSSASGDMSATDLLERMDSDVPAAADSFKQPYKLTCFKSTEDFYLVIDMHHALYDANAMATLLEDVEKIQRDEKLPPSVVFDSFLEHMLHGNEEDADAFFDGMLLNFKPQPFANLTPLRRVQQRLKAGSRLFDSLVLLQQAEQQLDESIWSFAGEKGDMDFPCILEVVPENDDLRISLHYQQSLFTNDDLAKSICDLFSDFFLSILRYPLSDFTYDTNIDRRGLDGFLKPQNVHKEDSQPSAAADVDDWTETEAAIRDVLLALSSVEPKNVTKHTTIYRLGLDSISAIQAASRLKNRGLNITAADILEHPTPAELAESVHRGAPAEAGLHAEVNLTAFDEKHRSALTDTHCLHAVRPCTAVQSGMLTAFLQSGGKDYLNHFAYDATFAGSAEKLLRGWEQILQKNDMLRTGFTEVEDSEHSFAMATFESDFKPIMIEILPSSDASFDQLSNQHQQEILNDLRKPTWRCKILEKDGKLEMFLTMHHALYDAVSLSHILGQLSDALEGRELKSQANVDSALVHIVSSSKSDTDQKKFWSEALQAVIPSRFPNLHPVVPGQTEILDINLTCAWSRTDLETLCSTQSVSLQAIFEAAWARLLSAYSGEEQVTFGIVHSGRVSQETQDACFPCINTLPLTCNTTTDCSQLLQQLMSFNAGVQKHCFTQLSSIQQWVGLQNEALFDTIFAFQKPLSDNQTSMQWKLTYEKAAVDYAVSIEVEHLPEDVLRLRTTFDSSVLPEQQARIMLQQLENIAMELLGQPLNASKSSEDLAIVPANDPIIKTDITLLHEMVDRTVIRHPERIALVFVNSIDGDEVQSETWTFQQLDRKGNQIARLLHDSGVKPGDVVGLCFEKCPEASFAFLGVLKAGCSILAIDVTAPTARKEFIVSDSSAAAILCSDNVAEELAFIEGIKTIDLVNALKEYIPDQPIDSALSLGPDSLSYILYTSGTTGTPKGCEITHENSVQALLSFQRLFAGRWTDKSIWLQFASYHFDVAILEHFWTWSVGMKLLCAPRDLILEDIASFIDRFQVTHLDLTPSLGRLLDPETVPSLHSGVFITGGEAVKPEMLRTWGEIGCLFNFYGPTETTIGVTTFPSVPSNGKASNIGWQFDNVGTCVLKPKTSDAVLRGGIGELCIFGKLVGKGYLNRPDMNQDRFPYIEGLGERIYRTGDLVRLLHDNSFEFLGRADSQVKLRGQRLEIDEIVAVMLQGENVKDAVCVVARQEEKQKDQLVAFITPSSDRKQGQPSLYQDPEISQMIQQAKATCEDKLPVYMVPTHFIPIHFIPLSVNNKQDDKQLKQFYQGLSTAQLQELSIPGTEQRELNDTENAIVTALSATLGTDLGDVKPDANLFALGLSSISAVQLARRLKSAGHPKASIATVMQNSTINKLGRTLADDSGSDDSGILAAKQAIAACQQKHLGQAAKTLGISVKDIERVVPCTPLQQGILYKSQSNEAGLYFNRFLFELNEIDLKKLKAAFEKLVGCVDVLRSAFVETEDGHVQVVRRKVNMAWKKVSVPNVDEAFEESHQDWIATNDRGLFNPLFVTLAVGTSPAKLQICIHHALYDGNSWGLFLQQLGQLYNGETPSSITSFTKILPHGPLRQNKHAKDFWQKHLQDAMFEQMPQLVGEPAKEDVLVSKAINVVQELDITRKNLQVTPQALVQAAWLATLGKYHAGPIGLIVSGRSLDVDAESVIGPLFNTIPFAWRVEEGQTWADLCKSCHNSNVQTLPYQHTPLRDISKWLGKSPVEPLFDTLFVFQQPQESNGAFDKIMKPIEDSRYVADYPLSFEAEQHPHGGLTITIGAQGHFCNDMILRQMIAQFEENLSALISNPEHVVTLPDSYTAKIKAGPVQRDLPDANGYQGPFEWTSEAKTIRKEMALLASVEETDLDEHTSIFAIGLDSIDAVRLSARLKKYGIIVPVSVLMRSQTIPKILDNTNKSIDKRNDSQLLAQRRERQVALERAVKQTIKDISGIEQVLAATPMQEALVSEMIRSEYKAYFNHDVMEIKSGVDVQRLEQAWDKVIEANPILRTAFVALEDPTVDATFAQAVLKHRTFKFTRHASEDGQQVDDLLNNTAVDFRAPKQLTAPLRLTLLEKDNKTFLVLSIAHALYDGYSLGLLHNDVNAAYTSTVPTRPSYSGIIDNAIEATGDQATSFWESLLTHVNRTHTPSTTTTPAQQTHRSELSSDLSSSAIKSFSKRHGITPQALCQTAWALHLSSLTHTLDVIYGLVLAGRDSPEAESVLFPTMNTVASRATIHGSVKEMLRSTQEQLLRIREYQQTPLRKITQIAKKMGGGFEGGLFDALFTYQKSPDAGEMREALYESVQGASDVEYPVAIEAELVGEELVWRDAVKSGFADQTGAEGMLRAVDEVLKRLVEKPEEEVLRFEGEGVSVMGQKVFKVVEKVKSGGGETVKGAAGEDEGQLTDAERKIRDVVAQVANTPAEEVGRTTKLENLGIDSISAIKLASLLKKQGINLAVSKIIRAGTIQAMAALQQSTAKPGPKQDVNHAASLIRKNGISASALGLDEEQVGEIMPVTAGQAYMLATWSNSEGKLFYPTFTYSLRGKADRAAVHTAWQTLVDCHAILRTTFIATQKKDVPYVQAVLKRRNVSLQQQTSTQPFANLDVTNEGKSTLLKLSIHHALYDAVSLQLLMQNLESLLNGQTLPSPISAFSSFISPSISQTSKAKQHSFWTSYLSDLSSPSARSTSHSGGKVQVFTPSALSLASPHHSRLRTSGLSLQSLFFATYAQLHARLHNMNDDLVIGIYLANRSTETSERLVAPTVNLLPVRVKTPTKAKTEDVAKQIQDDLKRISEEDVSATALWEIKEWTGVTVDVFVNFIKLPEEEETRHDAGGVRIESVDTDDEHEFRGRAEVVPVEDQGGWKVPEELKTSVWEAYPPSIDVEATVRDGKVAVGVFGFESVVGLERGKEIVEGTRKGLEGFFV